MCDKRPLVLWSGGTDSTCLVIELLTQGDIDIMYVDLKNNENQQRHEKTAIRKLRCIINDANLKGKIVNEHSFGYNTISVTKTMYVQPALWITAVAYIANINTHCGVNIAFIKYDAAWHYKTEIHAVYDAMNNLVCDGDTVPLVFPYEWKTKVDLINDLKDFIYYEQIMNLIYYCESGKKGNCGECSSCKRHDNELGIE